MSCVEDVPYEKQAEREVMLFQLWVMGCHLLVALNLRCTLFVLKQKKRVFREVCTWQSGKLATTVFLPASKAPTGDEDTDMQGSLEVLDPQGDEKLLNPARVA